jgi:hypothetical protein
VSDLKIVTREDLDRMKIAVGEKTMLLGCHKHPQVGSTVIYEDGHIRLLCHQCGFEAIKIKVASL